MDPRERYDELCDDLMARDGRVSTGQMMGMPSLLADGRMIGGFRSQTGSLVLKLPDATVRARALALEGTALFEPGGKVVFREWVVVPPAHGERWEELAAEALRLRG